jgi:hypothetical protein
MRKPLMLVAIGLAGLVLGLAGCGDDDDGNGGATVPTLTEGTTTIGTDTATDDLTTDATTTNGETGARTSTDGTTTDDDDDNSGSGGSGGGEG